MNRILFIAPLPPPVHGSAMVSKYIKDSAKVQSVAQCDWVNLSTSRRMDEIGKGGAMKLLRFMGAYLKTLWLLLTHRYDLCYLAITCHGIGFLKDAPFVWLCKMFGCRVLIHQHNKGMSNCIERWPYRWLIPYIYKRARVMLLSWHLYPDIAKVVKREQVVICANGIPGGEEKGERRKERGYVDEDENGYDKKNEYENEYENCLADGNSTLYILHSTQEKYQHDDTDFKLIEDDFKDGTESLASHDEDERLNAAEQRLIATASQVNVAEQRLKDTQSQGDDSPATALRLTSSSAAINRSEAASLPVNLLFLSNLIPSKGVYVLLDACRILKDKGLDFQCNFVGGETKEIDRARFEAEVQRRGLERMVRYEGPKYGEEKEKYWRSSDVFVQPTFEDCFPLTIVEAMQHGLPVVSTTEGAVPDMVADGVNGFVCERKDVSGLAGALERLITDASLRMRMGEVGRKRYEEEFTLERFEERFVSILTALISPTNYTN